MFTFRKKMMFFSTAAIHYLSGCSKSVLSFFKAACDLSVKELVYEF